MSTKRKIFTLLTITAAVTVLLFGLTAASIKTGADTDGKTVFEKKCAMCHGKDGVGDTKAGQMTKTPNLLTADWKQATTPAGVVETLKAGLGKMPKYEGKLSDEELEAVAAYVVELSGKSN